MEDITEHRERRKIEYATTEEIDIAKRGVGEFNELLEKSDFRQTRFLTKGDTAEMIQSMFLGIKPVCSIGVREIAEVEKISFPDRFHFVKGYLYDEKLVKNDKGQSRCFFRCYSRN